MHQTNIQYLLHLADTALILSHRNSEWCGHGPVLEQDIAITNIALDQLGLARNLYQYAAAQLGNTDEDRLAMMRPERAYTNVLLAELPKGNWGFTVLRQYFICQFQYLQYQQLQHHADEHLAAIAAKALKELKYHLRWSSEWVIRLGDGTEESHARITDALQQLWPYTGEMFIAANYEREAGADPATLQPAWMEQTQGILLEATLPVPENTFMHSGGKQGIHTESFGLMLTELQYLQRAYPGCEW
jgi:ring-1,2-phenylacetyl-CoA epoxidase subunit PaaC